MMQRVRLWGRVGSGCARLDTVQPQVPWRTAPDSDILLQGFGVERTRNVAVQDRNDTAWGSHLQRDPSVEGSSWATPRTSLQHFGNAFSGHSLDAETSDNEKTAQKDTGLLQWTLRGSLAGLVGSVCAKLRVDKRRLHRGGGPSRPRTNSVRNRSGAAWGMHFKRDLTLEVLGRSSHVAYGLTGIQYPAYLPEQLSVGQHQQ